MDRDVNLGPLVSRKQKEILQGQVEMALHQGGASISYGTHTDFKMKDKELENGHYFSPVVLEDMNPDSDIYHEEMFGPVFNLFKVDSSKEALDLANKSDYGLSSAIFTKDIEKAEAAAQRLRTGTVFLNTFSASGSDYPGGGIKASGYGRECYSDGLLEMGNRKTIIRKPIS